MTIEAMTTTLRDLMQSAQDSRGLSGRALAKLAQDHGHAIHNTQVNALLAGTYKSRPTRQLLEAVAWLAQVDVGDVYKSADLPLPGPPFADELPPESDQLLPHERRAVIEVIRAFLVSHALEERTDLSWVDRSNLSLHLNQPDDGDDSDGLTDRGLEPVELRTAARKTGRRGSLTESEGGSS